MTKIAVGFDFDHTLGLDRALEIHAFGKLAEHLGAQLDIAEPETHRAIEVLMQPFRAAEEPMSAMVARFASTIAWNGRAVGVAAEELAVRYRHICYDLVDQFVVPTPGARECIDALVSAGIPVGILTNGWSELQERKIVRALGAFPGPVLVSDLLGAYKPSAAAFRELEAALGVRPAQLWYVGDNPVADVAGALAYGLRAVWYNGERHPYPADLPPPTAEIEHLDALSDVVRGA